MSKMGGLYSVLHRCYPQYMSNIEHGNAGDNLRHISKSHAILIKYFRMETRMVDSTFHRIVRTLFDSRIDVNGEIFFNALGRLPCKESMRDLELDIYIPSLMIAFEYQGNLIIIISYHPQIKKVSNTLRKASKKEGNHL